MGGSLRRKKRARAAAGKRPARVGGTKNFAVGKALVDVAAVVLPGGASDAAITTSWDVERTPGANYALSGLASDPNRVGRGGRNEARDDEAVRLARTRAAAAADTTDEKLAACGETRTTGHAAPKRLTPKQTLVVERLVERYGEDLRAMSVDRKLNALQHTVGRLTRLVESYHFYAKERDIGDDKVRVDFRAPKKGRLRGKF